MRSTRLGAAAAAAVSRANRLLKLGAVMSCSVIALAACSSSGSGKAASGTSDTASGSSTATSSGPPAPTGAPIVIGVIGSTADQSTSQGLTVGPAWADYVNKTLGGIHGHPVKVQVMDDKSNPATAESAEETLVHSDNVVALVVSEDMTLGSYVKDAVAAHVPLISGTANNAAWFSTAGLYETPTDLFSGLTDQAEVAKKYAHATKFADVYCLEDPACSQADGPLRAASTKLGMGFASVGVSASATNYTAECLKLQQEHVDYAQLNISADEGARVIESCQAQGYNPTFGATGQSIGPALLAVPKLTLYGPAYAFPSSGNGPGVVAFRTAMTKYAKGDNWHDGTASFTWTGLETLRHALDLVSGTPTRASIAGALNTFNGVTLDGIVPNALTYTAGKPVSFGAHPCSFVIGIKDGKTVAPAGMSTVCASGK